MGTIQAGLEIPLLSILSDWSDLMRIKRWEHGLVFDI